jgi:hypothetical protein
MPTSGPGHDRRVREQRVVSDRPPPGRLPGALLGVAAGVLLASIWLFGASDVALAVTVVFGALVAVLLAGSPGWRSFATQLLVFAGAAGGLLFSIAWYRSHLGS